MRNANPESCVNPSKSRTPNTPTTSSLATRPMIVAIVALMLAKPRGAKIHLIALPMIPRTVVFKSVHKKSDLCYRIETV